MVHSALKAARKNRAENGSELVAIIENAKRRAHRFGFHIAAHALNRAKNALGWELAGDVEQAVRAGHGETMCTQDRIDEEVLTDTDDDLSYPGDECGRWLNGRLGQYCAKAGTEECDFECPYRDSERVKR